MILEQLQYWLSDTWTITILIIWYLNNYNTDYNTFHTCSRHIPDTFQTHCIHLADTLQTPSRQSPDTLQTRSRKIQTPSRQTPDTFLAFSTHRHDTLQTRVRPKSSFGNRNRIPDFSNLHSVIHYRNRIFQIAFRFRLNRNRNFYTWFWFRPEPDKGINRNSGRNFKFLLTHFWCRDSPSAVP